MTSARVAQITKISPHPHKSSLNLCHVFDGKQNFQVVCGTPHLKEGMVTIFAGVGSTLPPGQTLQEVNIAGINSPGMLCSAKDLGLSPESGIVNLPLHIPLGTPVEKVETKFLSSIPWHTYKKVDSLYQNPKTNRLTVCSPKQKKDTQKELIAETYFHEGHYLYRDFLRGKIC